MHIQYSTDRHATIVRRVQLVWAPPGTALCLFAFGSMEKGPNYGVHKVKESFWPVITTNWMVCTQSVSFIVHETMR